MCINLSWNRPGQRCQHEAATDAAFLDKYGEALREDALSISSGADAGIEAKDHTTTMSPNTELPMKPNTSRPIMRTITTAAFLFAGLIAMAQTPAETQAVTLAREGALVVDVREPNEVAQVAYDVPNVVNIPLGQLAERVNEIPKDRPVVIACQAGGRSAQAMEALQKLGYTNLVDLEGGLYAWQEAGMPVKKSGTAAGGCCAGGKTAAAGCGDAKSAANCSPEKKKAGCCSGAPKAAAPAPADKQPAKQ